MCEYVQQYTTNTISGLQTLKTPSETCTFIKTSGME